MDTVESKLMLWGAFVVGQFIAGYWIVRGGARHSLLWILPALSIGFSHFLFWGENGVLRMLALIMPLLHSMKVIVARRHTKGKLPLAEWFAYYFLTVNMNPSIFNKPRKKEIDWVMFFKGLLHLLLGVAILIGLRFGVGPSLWGLSAPVFLACSAAALFGMSLVLHFGLLPLGTFAFKAMGIQDYAMFRKPFQSKSLSEFWGRRWNVAFSEMTAIAVFKPLSKRFGVKWAGFVSFMLSGLLHEVAISLSVMEGFGLPMLYFLIHGLLMLLEKRLFPNKEPGFYWVAFCLIAPAFLLFHLPFLRGVVWAVLLL